MSSGYPYRFLIEPAMRLAHQLDIGNNPDPIALYDARGGCINVWATPEDNPGGIWKNATLTAGAHCKKSEFVGTISWRWDTDIKYIVALVIDSNAMHLHDEFPRVYSLRTNPTDGRLSVKNRPDDLHWVKKKAEILFAQLGLWGLVPVYYANEIKEEEKS